VPESVREKRFANWLRDAHDWAVSRNRYWGNPMPLWVSDDFEEIVCVGSLSELEELSGVKVTDLHRERWEALMQCECNSSALNTPGFWFCNFFAAGFLETVRHFVEWRGEPGHVNWRLCVCCDLPRTLPAVLRFTNCGAIGICTYQHSSSRSLQRRCKRINMQIVLTGNRFHGIYASSVLTQIESLLTQLSRMLEIRWI